MPDECPHCGASVRVSGDAFCSECRGALDEAPSSGRVVWLGAGHDAQESIQLPQYRRPEPDEVVSGIVGAEELTWSELEEAIDDGGRLVFFQYCVSIGILTFLRQSPIYLIRVNESTFAKGIRYTFLSLIAGWWGFPWGFIYTPAAILNNIGGGKDVTAAVFPDLPAHRG